MSQCLFCVNSSSCCLFVYLLACLFVVAVASVVVATTAFVHESIRNDSQFTVVIPKWY